MEINEVQEIHEHAEHARHDKGLLPVSLTMAIIAVLVAVVTMMGHRAHTEEVLLQGEVTDQWSYYQAKNTQSALAEQSLDLISASNLAAAEKKALADKYKEKGKRYAERMSELQNEAHHLEAERNATQQRAVFLDISESLLEAALVVVSITLLTTRRKFWYTGMIVAAAGAVVAIVGVVLH
jgi:hypothetical protein